MEKISGIYMIKNKLNGKIYIGQSADIYSRWIKHKNFLKNNNHHNKHLQAAWNKYGEDTFEFSIVERCPCDKLDLAETHWIAHYSSYDNGYNLDCGGSGIRGYKHTEEELEKMRKIQNPLSVLQFDLELNLLNEWVSVTTASKQLGYSRDAIRSRCNNDKFSPNLSKVYKNCYWVYKEEYQSEDFSWEKNLNWISTFEHPKKRIRKLKEPVCQYDSNFNLIKKWHSVDDILSAGYNVMHVMKMCGHQGNIKRYNDEFWAYESDDFSDEYFVVHKPLYAHNAVKVEQYTLDGEYIQTFNSLREASLAISGHIKADSNIIQAINTNGTSFGYRWKRA